MPKRRVRESTKWLLMEKPAPGVGRVIGQVRYSSDLQDGGFTIEQQKHYIEESAAKDGWPVIGWTEERATSGTGELHERPLFEDLLTRRAGTECNVIMCHEASRWTRNQSVGDKALELLRQRHCWWQTADGQWDINKPLQEGFDIVWAITQVTNASYVRKLSAHVKKGKEGKARLGYSNGIPPYGYQIPIIQLATLIGQTRRERGQRIVYEPHPDYFPVLQALGELLAEEPPITISEIARIMNQHGYRYSSHKYGERSWSPDIISALYKLSFQREFAPDSGKGTIILPSGEAVEGLHVAAWPYETWQKIDANRQQLLGNRSGSIHKRRLLAFAGLICCAACGRRLHSRSTDGKYSYYKCARALTMNMVCPVANDGVQDRGVRAEVVDAQFEHLLHVLGHWSQEAIQYLSSLSQDDHGPDPVIEYERQRKLLRDRRERVRDMYEMGDYTRQEYQERIARIAQEEARLQRPVNQSEEVAREVKAVNELRNNHKLWQDAHGYPQVQQKFIHTLLSPKGLIFDLKRQKIVGIRPHQHIFRFVKFALGQEGWSEKEAGLLWHDDPDLPTRPIVNRYRQVMEALKAGYTNSSEIGRLIGVKRQYVVTLLTKMRRQGYVLAENVSETTLPMFRYAWVGGETVPPDALDFRPETRGRRRGA